VSLVFEALKKGQAADASPVGVAPDAQLARVSASATAAAGAPAPVAWSRPLVALLAGLAVAAIGAALYGAGRSSGAAQEPERRAAAPAPNPGATRTMMEPAAAVAQAPAAADAKSRSSEVAEPKPPGPTPVTTAAPVLAPAPPAGPAAISRVAAAAPAAAPRPKAVLAAAVAPAEVKARAPAIVATTSAPVVVAALSPVAALPVTPAAAASAPAAAAPVLVPAPAVKAPINTNVQISTQPSPLDVREAFQSFLRQTQMRQWPEAQRTADQIATALGAGHVMALRAQGYLALQQDDLPRARSQYLQLQQTLPEDREAGLNLALIEWRSGDREAAASRLVGLVQKFPNDPQIQALSQNVKRQ
jgi:hypothetical protein